MKQKKILIIGPTPPPYAGPEIVTLNLLKSEEINNNFNIVHLNTTIRKSNTEKGKFDLYMIYGYIIYIFNLLKIIIFKRPNIIFYLPTSASVKGWFRDGSTIFISYLLRKKICILFQGGHFGFFYQNLKKPYQNIIKWLLNKCTNIFVQADRLKNQFSDIIIEKEKIITHYNCIDNDFYNKFNTEKIKNVSNKPLTILFVGHLSQAKGYCDLLKIIPDICANYSVKFQFMGTKKNVERNVFYNQATGEQINIESPDKIYKEFITTKNLDKHIEFLGGSVYGEEKIKYFSNADIFTLPSYSEGFSTAILEAMSAGLPILATKVGSASEVLKHGENGFIVNPGDIKHLKYYLLELIKSETLRKEISVANRRKCKEYFLLDVVNKNLVINLLKI